jgi:hypothetical protein
MMDESVTCAPPEQDLGLNKVINWKYKLCWRPNTCFLTGKQLLFKWAYHGTRIITRPGSPVLEDYWVDRDKFLIWNLTK